MSDPGRQPLLRVRDLKVQFRTGSRGPFRKPTVVHAVDGISFDVPRGTTFGIVGESGSGKSTTALAIMRLAPITHGTIELAGARLSEAEGSELLGPAPAGPDHFPGSLFLAQPAHARRRDRSRAAGPYEYRRSG